jgi:hypothetical protein
MTPGVSHVFYKKNVEVDSNDYENLLPENINN